MQTVWVLTTDEYPDFHVLGVFTSREKAEIMAEKIGGCDIQEWETDPWIEHVR